MDRRGIGKFGEDLAVKYLERNGFEIIVRNFQTRYGEIDIVARHKKTLLFVEVKTRSSVLFGTPEDAVTGEKQRKLRLMAEYFLKISGRDTTYNSWRIDIIGILVDRAAGKAHLTHIKNAVGE